MRLTVPTCVLVLSLMLAGCQTTPIVIDAGCATWAPRQFKPSRADTPETARRLYVLNEAMREACR